MIGSPSWSGGQAAQRRPLPVPVQATPRIAVAFQKRRNRKLLDRGGVLIPLARQGAQNGLGEAEVLKSGQGVSLLQQVAIGIELLKRHQHPMHHSVQGRLSAAHL